MKLYCIIQDGKPFCSFVKENVGDDCVCVEVESPDDVYVENGVIAIRTPEQIHERKMIQLRQQAHEKNRSTYSTVYTETDNEFLKYQKRKEADILRPQDEADYQQALQQYTDATILYLNTKTAIDATMTEDELRTYVCDISPENV